MGGLKLFRNAVRKPLLDCLEKLMLSPELVQFYLVGGTSLALRLGHRLSVDIDIFRHHDFDAVKLSEFLTANYNLENVAVEKNTVRGSIDSIKIDLISHQYPLLEEIETIDGIRMASLADVAAMKLNAIANRGSKKDFWDYAALLELFDRRQMLEFFRRKYQMANVWHVEKSLLYFDDAENDPDPICVNGKTWTQIKQTIVLSVRP